MKTLPVFAAVGLLMLAAPVFADDTPTPVPLAPAASPARPASPTAPTTPADPGAATPAPATGPATPAASPAPADAADGPEIKGVPPDTGPRLSNFAGLVFSGTSGESAPEITMDFTAGAMLGTMPLVFEKTGLDDLQKSFGGTLQTQGDAGDGVSWLCYTQHARTKADTPRTVWFTSTNEMADQGHTLSMVVVQNVDAAKVSGCLTAPKDFVFPSFGVPAMGATAADLKAKYGPLKRDRSGNVYFNSTRALGDGSGQSVYQSVSYDITRKKGVVVGFALSQVTTD